MTRLRQRPRRRVRAHHVRPGELTADQVVVATGPYQVPAHRRRIGRAAARRHRAAALARSTAGRASCPPARCWSSAPASPAARSPRTCTWPGARCTWPSAAHPGWPARYRGRDVVAWLDDMGYYRQGHRASSPTLDAVRFRANHYVTGRDGGRDIDLRAFARDGMRLYGRLSGIGDGRLTFAADLRRQPGRRRRGVGDRSRTRSTRYIDASGIVRAGRGAVHAGVGPRRRAARARPARGRASPR